jgi:hypothetical protein
VTGGGVVPDPDTSEPPHPPKTQKRTHGIAMAKREKKLSAMDFTESLEPNARVKEDH